MEYYYRFIDVFKDKLLDSDYDEVERFVPFMNSYYENLPNETKERMDVFDLMINTYHHMIVNDSIYDVSEESWSRAAEWVVNKYVNGIWTR